MVAYVDIGDRDSYPGTGATVVDLIGNLTSGTITSAVYTNGTLEFDGASGDLSFTKDADTDNIFAGGGSAMGFFRADGNGEGSSGFIASTSGWSFFVANPAGSLLVEFTREFDTTAGSWQSVAAPTLRLGSWNSFAVVYDDGSVTNQPVLYLNGVVIAFMQTSVPVGSASTDVGSSLVVGNRAADDRTFDGQIDVVTLYDGELSVADVAQTHSAFLSRHGGFTAVGSLSVAAGPKSGTGPAGDLYMEAGAQTSGGTGSTDNSGSLFLRAGLKGSLGGATQFDAELAGRINLATNGAVTPGFFLCGEFDTGGSAATKTIELDELLSTGWKAGVYDIYVAGMAFGDATNYYGFKTTFLMNGAGTTTLREWIPSGEAISGGAGIGSVGVSAPGINPLLVISPNGTRSLWTWFMVAKLHNFGTV